MSRISAVLFLSCQLIVSKASLPQAGEVVDQALPSPSYVPGSLWYDRLTNESSHLMQKASLPQAGEVVDQALPSPSYVPGSLWYDRLTNESSHLMQKASLPQAGEVVDQALPSPSQRPGVFAWSYRLTNESSHLMQNASLPQAGEVVDQALPSPSLKHGIMWSSLLHSHASHSMHILRAEHAGEVIDQNKGSSFVGIRFFATRDDLVRFFNFSLGSDRMALVIEAPSIHNRTLRVLATKHVPGDAVVMSCHTHFETWEQEQAPYCHSLPKGTKVALARVQFVDDGHIEVVVWMEHKLDGDCVHDCDKFNHIAERVIFQRTFLQRPSVAKFLETSTILYTNDLSPTRRKSLRGAVPKA